MSYQERMEGLQRRANIASSRANPERRQMARDSMRNFFGGLFNKLKPKGNAGGGRQYFGSSPLQQAMAQRDAGMLTPAGAELLKGMEMNPEEMARQEALMAQGRHGDYGVNRQAQPYYTDATTELMPQGEQGPTESIAQADGTVTPSASVQAGDVEGVDQRLLLDRIMKNPSKINAEGVKSMQTALNSLGFRDKDGNMLSVDGKMGPLTASAMEAYRGQLGQGAEGGQALDPIKVVSGVDRANRWGQGERKDGVVPITRYEPYGGSDGMGGYENEWDFISRGGGNPNQSAGYVDIQQTIGNPDNDPIMFGVDDLSDLTNPFR